MLLNISRKNFLFLIFLSSIVIVVVIIFRATTTVKSQYECFNTEVDTKNSTLELVHIVSQREKNKKKKDFNVRNVTKSLNWQTKNKKTKKIKKHTNLQIKIESKSERNLTFK